MSEPFLSEIRIFSFSYAPKGWAFCNGQLMPISQYQALFALLGTIYGGDGVQTFGLPNLQGRIPIHRGNGFILGQNGGEAAHTLSQTEMAAHSHTMQASSASSDQTVPTGNLWANGNDPAYSGTANATMNATLMGAAGGSQAHNNMSPYLVISFCIALQGIFPSQT